MGTIRDQVFSLKIQLLARYLQMNFYFVLNISSNPDILNVLSKVICQWAG